MIPAERSIQRELADMMIVSSTLLKAGTNPNDFTPEAKILRRLAMLIRARLDHYAEQLEEDEKSQARWAEAARRKAEKDRARRNDDPAAPRHARVLPGPNGPLPDGGR